MTLNLPDVMKYLRHLNSDDAGFPRGSVLVTGSNKDALKLRCNVFLMCVCDIECNWVNSKSNVGSALLEACAMRPHVPDFQMNQGFSTVLMPPAKCVGLFQILNITSNKPGRVSGVTVAESAFSGLEKPSLLILNRRLQ